MASLENIGTSRSPGSEFPLSNNQLVLNSHCPFSVGYLGFRCGVCYSSHYSLVSSIVILSVILIVFVVILVGHHGFSETERE